MIINNVQMVLQHEVVNGSLEVRDGIIRQMAPGASQLPQALDGGGGWLLPGLIELHTDNLDKFFTPRPNDDWPSHSAMSSHDALMVANGITTVLDSPQKYRKYTQGKYHLSDRQMDEYEQQQIALSARWSAPNRAAIAAHCRRLGITLASHDDATAEHVRESHGLGSAIAEFPTTEEAALVSHRLGLQVLMGNLIYLMGPSGSGKDSLLNALKCQPGPALIVAHRYITRPAGAGGENHIELSEAAFAQRRDRGLFALHWQAHQLSYALGIEIDLWLRLGLTVAVNGSRNHLQPARLRYGTQLMPICLHVAPEVLYQRLSRRGRETAEEIAQRLARAQAYRHSLPGDCPILDNNGPLADTLEAMQTLLLIHKTPYPQEGPL